MDFELPWGKRELIVSIDSSKVLGIIEGKKVSCLMEEEIDSKLEEGIKLLARKCDSFSDKVVILVPDVTRLWSKGRIFVPKVVEHLVANGIPLQNLEVIIGTGLHRPCSKEEIPLLVGEEVTKKVFIKNHIGNSIEKMVYLGETTRGTPVYVNKEVVEADCVILFGGVMVHLLAGFGGGRKMVLPGVSAALTIQKNHSLALMCDGSPNPMVSQTVLDGNPVNEDMIEAARLLLKDKRSLLVNVAVNEEGKVFHLAVGDWLESWFDACEKVKETSMVYTEEKADFVVLSAGGYEKDAQLYQSTKALFNIVDTVREGGDIVFFSECRDGLGNEEFVSVLKRFRGRRSELGRKLLENFTIPSYVAFRLMEILERFKVTLISRIGPDEVGELGFQSLAPGENLSEMVCRLKGRGYLIPSGENVLPVSK